MYFDKKAMLTKLQQQVSENIMQAKQLLAEPDSHLIKQPVPASWSVLQVIAHLNTYNDFYLPRLTHAVASSQRSTVDSYKAGWLGNYFVKMMQPGNDPQKKFKAARKHTPATINNTGVINKYISGQQQLLELLEGSFNIDLQKQRVQTSLSPLIKMRMGDVYRFLVAHQQRHFGQIERALQTIDNRALRSA